MRRIWLKALFTLFCAGFAAAVAADCVVLLHGLARTSNSMEDLERAFAARGYRVANIDYPSREQPIEHLSSLVFEQAASACAAGDDEQVHFVTHSLGGILVRYFLAEHRLPNLGRVVMLAPPNGGSEVVDELADLPGFELFGGPSGQQLGTGPDSIPPRLGPVDYPVGIIAGTRTVNPILSQYLPNPDDGKVSVARTRVEGMADFLTLPVSHPFIMSDEEVIRQAVAFVETGAFVHDEALYFIDAHSQVDHNIALESVVSLMKEAGIKTTILAARGKRAPKEIAALAEKYPDRVVAAVRTKGKPYQRNTGEYYRELDKQLDSGRFNAMAEVLLYHASKGSKADKVMVFPDDKRVEAAFEGARKQGWPFILHVEFASLGDGKRKIYRAALEDFLERHPEHPVVLIHMGQLDVTRVKRLIDRYPNIYFLTSHSNPVATERSGQPWVNMFRGGVLAPEWEALLVARPERFVFALDNVWPEHWREGYKEQVQLWRQALDRLPSDAAAAVAHGNAEALWNLH